VQALPVKVVRLRTLVGPSRFGAASVLTVEDTFVTGLSRDGDRGTVMKSKSDPVCFRVVPC